MAVDTVLSESATAADNKGNFHDLINVARAANRQIVDLDQGVFDMDGGTHLTYDVDDNAVGQSANRQQRMIVRGKGCGDPNNYLNGEPHGTVLNFTNTEGPGLIVNDGVLQARGMGLMDLAVYGPIDSSYTGQLVKAHIIPNNSIFERVVIGGGKMGQTGTHNGANNASILSDSGATWTADAFIGLTVRNTTDGSEGVITDNDGTTITATLAGGTDNDWDSGDAYEIVGEALSIESIYSAAMLRQVAIVGKSGDVRGTGLRIRSGVGGDLAHLFGVSVTNWADGAILGDFFGNSPDVGAGFKADNLNASGCARALTVMKGLAGYDAGLSAF